MNISPALTRWLDPPQGLHLSHGVGLATSAGGRASSCPTQIRDGPIPGAQSRSPSAQISFRNEAAVFVSVTDRGAGIAPEHLDRIFDRFYRADPSRTRSSGGTGLGLAITQSIMKMHGGDVVVTSEPGRSTVFTLSIPHMVRESSDDAARSSGKSGRVPTPTAVAAHPVREVAS